MKGFDMKLLLESDDLTQYLQEIPPVISFSNPIVKKKIQDIQASSSSTIERAKLAFQCARDEIQHSFDTQSLIITITAEETLEKKEGICFAKAHLLATLLRGLNIPAGFCYQRVLRKGAIESGYALHGLNAIYLKECGWFRLDPRGNKVGINSLFSIEEERLAYPIREHLGEKDYPNVFTRPLESVLEAMRSSTNCQELFYKRPEAL